MNTNSVRAGRILAGGMLLILTALLVGLPAAHAGDSGPDMIRLTDARISQFTKTQQAVNALLQAHPELKAKAQAAGDAKTLDETVERINAIPGMQAAIASGGMSTGDYVLCTATLFATALAAGMVQQAHSLDKMKPGLEKDNIEYLLSHQQQVAPALKLLMANSQSGDASAQ